MKNETPRSGVMLSALQLLAPEEQVEYPESQPDEQLGDELPDDAVWIDADLQSTAGRHRSTALHAITSMFDTFSFVMRL